MARSRKSRGKGKFIPLNLKMQLIESVFTNEKSVHESAIEIGLKYSTAKAIVKRFRQTNSIERKKSKKTEAISDRSSSPEEQMEPLCKEYGKEIIIPKQSYQYEQIAYFPTGPYLDQMAAMNYPFGYSFYPFQPDLSLWNMI